MYICYTYVNKVYFKNTVVLLYSYVHTLTHNHNPLNHNFEFE